MSIVRISAICDAARERGGWRSSSSLSVCGIRDDLVVSLVPSTVSSNATSGLDD